VAARNDRSIVRAAGSTQGQRNGAGATKKGQPRDGGAVLAAAESAAAGLGSALAPATGGEERGRHDRPHPAAVPCAAVRVATG